LNFSAPIEQCEWIYLIGRIPCHYDFEQFTRPSCELDRCGVPHPRNQICRRADTDLRGVADRIVSSYGPLRRDKSRRTDEFRTFVPLQAGRHQRDDDGPDDHLLGAQQTQLPQEEAPPPYLAAVDAVHDQNLVDESWVRGEFGDGADFDGWHTEKTSQQMRNRLRLILSGQIECSALQREIASINRYISKWTFLDMSTRI